MEGNHTLHATQKNFAVTGHAECIFIDGCQREAIFGTVILEILVPIVKDGEALIGDEQ